MSSVLIWWDPVSTIKILEALDDMGINACSYIDDNDDIKPDSQLEKELGHPLDYTKTYILVVKSDEVVMNCSYENLGEYIKAGLEHEPDTLCFDNFAAVAFLVKRQATGRVFCFIASPSVKRFPFTAISKALIAKKTVSQKAKTKSSPNNTGIAIACVVGLGALLTVGAIAYGSSRQTRKDTR